MLYINNISQVLFSDLLSHTFQMLKLSCQDWMQSCHTRDTWTTNNKNILSLFKKQHWVSFGLFKNEESGDIKKEKGFNSNKNEWTNEWMDGCYVSHKNLVTFMLLLQYHVHINFKPLESLQHLVLLCHND